VGVVTRAEKVCEGKHLSDSYPTIQDSLSEMQKEFMGCVETHLDPPGGSDPSYRVEALWHCDDGDAIRFTLSVDETDPDISERRHAIEFLSQAREPFARVSHSMKRVEASQGRFFWTESEFHVAAPDMPAGRLPHAEVEDEVKTYVDRVRELDRDCRLIEL
jgi:hypothetical protein